MAFASSRIGAQEAIIKLCDLCEDDENVNWFCKDCVKNLCERCKKGHLKIAICKNHHLVSILEGVAIAKRNVSNLCRDHEEPFSFFCRSCEKNICSYCLSTIHKKHDFIGIGELQSELHKELNDALKEKMGEKEQITKNLDSLVIYEKRRGEALTRSYTTVDDRVKAIQLAAAEEGQKLKKSLATSANQQLAEVKENKRKLKAKRNAYCEEIQTIQQELTLQTVSTLNQFVKTSTSKLQSLKPMSFPTPQGNTFTAGTVNMEQIRDMIGKDGSTLHVSKPLEIAEKVGNSILHKLKIVSMYNMPVEYCYSICPSPDGSIWIGGQGYVYKMMSGCSTVLHQIPARTSGWPCCYIACFQSGDAVVSYGGETYIDRFTSDGRRVKFTDLSPRDTCDIAVTNHDEVVVSVKPWLFSQTWSIVILSKEGKRLNEIDMDTRNTHRFCIDKAGNFITSDSESTCLITLDRDGAVLKTREISKHNSMQMICDNHGNILIVFGGQKDEKDVYLISYDGKIERSFTIQCNKRINGICISRENRLLILVDYKNVIVAEYFK